eukprot:896519-Pelagomonas_calceolata.AAC.3
MQTLVIEGDRIMFFRRGCIEAPVSMAGLMPGYYIHDTNPWGMQCSVFSLSAAGVAEVMSERDSKSKKNAPPKKPPLSPKESKKEREDSVPRPFGLLTWALPCGNLDLASLGWTNEPGSGLPQHMKVVLQAGAVGTPRMAHTLVYACICTHVPVKDSKDGLGKPEASPGAKGKPGVAVAVAAV